MRKKLGLMAGLLCFYMPVHADELDNQLTPYLDKIYVQLTEQSEKSVQSCLALKKTLVEANIKKPADVSQIKAEFTSLLLDWKRVQSTYVIGEYDGEAIDLPHYIDVYHRGNEKLSVQIQRALDSKDSVKDALFKHSFKTINALEYTLFSTPTLSERQLAFAQVITDNICKNLGTIQKKYTLLRKDFEAEPKKSVAVLINELIDSSYKLKEWRFGDPAGLSRKYKGKTNGDLVEYRLSRLSVPAASAILETHARLTKKDGDFAYIVKILAKPDAPEDSLLALEKANKNTLAAILLIKPLTDADMDNTATIKPVYESLNNVYDSYFPSLIASMSDVVSKILDSDGD